MDTIGDGQEGQQAARKKTNSRAKVGDSKKSCEHSMGQNEAQAAQREVIYALLDAAERPFYVGRTVQPIARLAAHKANHGPAITMKILEHVSFDEAAQVEGRWIAQLRAEGASLVNKLLDVGPRKDGFIKVRLTQREVALCGPC